MKLGSTDLFCKRNYLKPAKVEFNEPCIATADYFKKWQNNYRLQEN